MPDLYPKDQLPPAGEKVTWEVQVRGHCTWTIYVAALTPEEAVALAAKELDDVDLKPDDEPEPDMSDIEVNGWESLPPTSEAAE